MSNLGDVIQIKNGKIASKGGSRFPIFGGNGIIGFSDIYNYDDIIIIGRVGANCGSVHRYKGKCWVSDNALAGVAINDCSDFNYYLIKSINLNSRQIGSSQPLLTQTILYNLDINFPEKFKTQKKIAAVLSALDEKIELNNQLNAQLEQIAKTVYDYWFVQFDFPDENGKPYKSSGGEMVFNEVLKREIPVGWEVKSLYQIANFINGLACQKYRPKNEDDPFLLVIKIREMNDGISTNTEKVRVDIPEKNIINDGDVLFSWSATLDVKIWTEGKAGLNQHIFKVISDKFPRSFYYFETLNYLHHFKMMAELRKTTMGHITVDHLKSSFITIPRIEIINKLDEKINPILEKIISSKKQNQELAQLRDWLLPMLMNGQVRVREN